MGLAVHLIHPADISHEQLVPSMLTPITT